MASGTYVHVTDGHGSRPPTTTGGTRCHAAILPATDANYSVHTLHVRICLVSASFSAGPPMTMLPAPTPISKGWIASPAARTITLLPSRPRPRCYSVLAPCLTCNLLACLLACWWCGGIPLALPCRCAEHHRHPLPSHQQSAIRAVQLRTRVLCVCVCMCP